MQEGGLLIYLGSFWREIQSESPPVGCKCNDEETSLDQVAAVKVFGTFVAVILCQFL